MTNRKEKLILALEVIKNELLASIDKKPVSGKKKKRPIFPQSHLKVHFDNLAKLLESEDPPNKIKIMTVVAPLIDALESEEDVPVGLMDLLPTGSRKSILMLFLFSMLRDVDDEGEQARPNRTVNPKPDYPDKVPLDISEGDDIDEGVVASQVPYGQKPQQKLDVGF